MSQATYQDHVTYQELVEHYGDKMAYALLRIVEKRVNIEGTRTDPTDRNIRLQRALHVFDKTSLREIAA